MEEIEVFTGDYEVEPVWTFEQYCLLLDTIVAEIIRGGE